jgi:exodeoxyribonuclease-3
MKIATWNVNSIRVRLPHVLDWLAQQQPDVLCLQETKVPDEEFPVDTFNQAGYSVAYAGQKTYNGVATLSRLPANEVVRALPEADGVQKRLLVVAIDDVRVVNVYVPNGEAVDSDKYGEAFGTLVADGLVDVFRKVDQPAASFSWWDYRMGGFRRDLGLRIDHILTSRALASTCRACYIDKAPRGLERPSDHAPVIAEFEI